MSGRKPAANCAVCGKPISKAADAQVIDGRIVHRACAERMRRRVKEP